MKVYFLDHSFKTGAENLALEELLLKPLIKNAEVSPMVRIWDNPETSIVLGRAEKAEAQIQLDACRRDGVPIYRRVSGGGTVTHGPGNLNLSFFLPFSMDEKLSNLKASYELILSWVQNSLLETLGLTISTKGTCDLCLGEKKISGTAQARKRHGILHHLTLLIDFDLDLISRYQKEPEKQPEYRAKRNHHDFVTNLTQDQIGFDRERFISNLMAQFEETETISLDSDIIEETQNLASFKYSNPLWTLEGKEPKA